MTQLLIEYFNLAIITFIINKIRMKKAVKMKHQATYEIQLFILIR